MSLPIVMHVNYCEQGQTLAEMCRKAAGWGFDGIEFRRVRQGVQETPEEYLDAVADAVAASGLRAVLFGGPGVDLMQPDPAARQREVDRGEAFYRLAAERFRLTVCNCMAGPLRNPDPAVPYMACDRQGSGVAADRHYEWATAGYRRLGAVAQELGVKLAFETHMGYLHDLPAPTSRLLDLIGSPAVGANLDYGNMVYFPRPPALEEAVRALGSRIFMVHLKNSVTAGDGRLPVALADGTINNREFLRLLRAVGFASPLCVEAPRGGDREWFAQQDIAYLKALLSDLES